MYSSLFVASGLFAAAAAASASTTQLDVPACPDVKTIQYSLSVPDLGPFALTQVDLCYSEKHIEMYTRAYNETSFYYDPAHSTNDELYLYTVTEAFISRGDADPSTYLEYEVSPNPEGVTFNAFIYNPTKDRSEGAPFDRFYIAEPYVDGFTVETTMDEEAELWTSKAQIPFALFNVDDGEAKETKWRMNFYRTTWDVETEVQGLSAWIPMEEANFHITSLMGHVTFV